MTGYGSVERVFKEGRLSIELKALNSRFFELHFKTPREFSFFEPKAVLELKKKFKRGSFDLFVSWQPENGGAGRRELNRSLLNYYLKTVRNVQRDLKIPGAFPIDRVLSLPDIWKSSSSSSGSLSQDIYWKMFYPVLRRCIAKVEMMRNREGVLLHKVLRKQLSDLKKEARTLTDLRGQWIQHYETRLQERIRTYLADKAFDSGRLHQEAALLISRTDIQEELDRLTSHVAQCFSIIDSKGIDSKGEIGKKFDFLLQEMNREVNTIGSKTQDFSISSSVIRMKSLIEKLREQIQNVE